jgi:hypothetical protein
MGGTLYAYIALLLEKSTLGISMDKLSYIGPPSMFDDYSGKIISIE